MRTLRGRFIRNNLLIILISAASVLCVSALLLFVFVKSNHFDILHVIRVTFDYPQEAGEVGFAPLRYMILWGVLAMSAVITTCILMSRSLAKSVLQPVEQLQKAAVNLAEGNLDFNVMACEDRELADLCAAFEEIRMRLKENARQDVRGQEERNMLIANLSHDMRTPVTSIMGYVEGIRDGVAATPEKQRQYLDTIYNKTLVLQTLLDNMSEYSELELGRMQYVFEYIDVNAYLLDLIGEYSMDIKERGMELSWKLPPDGLHIVGDRNKLKRVMDNLISNAVKYNRKGGRINLSTETNGKGVFICVSDTGEGISKDDLGQVFDGFFRGDTARSNSKGSGLGLAISRQIVESHHGKIWMKSEESVGTTVYLYLPLRERPEV